MVKKKRIRAKLEGQVRRSIEGGNRRGTVECGPEQNSGEF